MNIIKHLSDPCPFTSNEKAESSSTSASNDTSSSQRTSHSDEEFLLATNRPKKRAGRRVFKETRHPTFRGVRRRNNNKWVCELREPNKKTRLWLGTYPIPEMAARAHDVAALALRGKSACLNFADSAWRLPVPATMDGKDIKRAATEAAEMFRPREVEEIDVSTDDDDKVVVHDEAWRLPVPATMDGKDIKRAATEAAEMFKPREVEEIDVSTDDDNKDVVHDEEISSDIADGILCKDEEEILDLPRLLVDMAQGLLIPPPRFLGDVGMDWDEEADIGVSLWTFSA